ncbi:MAG: proline--tRNA ligase [Candidatus Magasanikbacteria bacterium]|nr:proline--tRNA ligase [Candidatus Magasanikbacteria bacterium]NCS72290.1 proline--tRNA ligase [Candidatus Magasanikbacteria bacterium]
MSQKTAITPTRKEDYPEWYQQVIKAADMAEHSPVRGCMVIKPWGYAIWENIQKHLDKKFKETGHENAYFPIFIPKSFLEKEAKHVDGFAKECAVVTHHRLEEGPDGKLVPAGELEEPLIVRPTSETIIGAMFEKWVESYRDLPILINQWANVVRWEMRTRLFLRTSEFLWQEGHTAHATKEEAQAETMQMLDIYEVFARDILAMPVIKGEKTATERFPGADNTYTIESLMQDNKALQAGTSHFLGQNFAKAQDISFVDQEGETQYAWTTSWGVSTRLIGGIIMTHSDDNGLVLPPKIAPIHVVIIPIFKTEEEKEQVLTFAKNLKGQLDEQQYNNQPLVTSIDTKDQTNGEKNWKHIKKGVPIRLEIGPRDIEKNSVFMARRDQEANQKTSVTTEEFISSVVRILDEIQETLYTRALVHTQNNSQHVETKEAFEQAFSTDDNPGYVSCFADDSEEYEDILKSLKASARCMPLSAQDERGTCIFTEKEDCRKILFARSY